MSYVKKTVVGLVVAVVTFVALTNPHTTAGLIHTVVSGVSTVATDLAHHGSHR